MGSRTQILRVYISVGGPRDICLQIKEERIHCSEWTEEMPSHFKYLTLNL